LWLQKNEGEGKVVKKQYSNSRRIGWICPCKGKSGEKCGYKVKSYLAYDSANGTFSDWVVRKVAPHTCRASTDLANKAKFTNYSPEQLVPAFVESVNTKEGVKPSALKKLVQNYTFRSPSSSFVSRLRAL